MSEIGEFQNIDHLIEKMKLNGVNKLIFKRLSPNDNSKNQIYLGSSYDILQTIPMGEIYIDRSKKDSKRDRFKANINFYWLDTTGEIVFFGISDRTNQKKGLLFTLFQLLKIGKIHPAKLLLNSQSIHGLNLLAIGDKNPEQITYALEKLISLVKEKKIMPHAKHGFDWDKIALAHHGIENGDFTGKVFIKVNN